MPKQNRLREHGECSLAPVALADQRDWRSDQVGWGLVLPDDPALNPADKARGTDAPEPLRALLKDRGDAPVLRWSPGTRDGHLRRYYPDGGDQLLPAAAADFGVGPGKIPRYLLIYATPADIPWSVQYSLNLSCFVGRLTLTGEALENYVAALLDDWRDGTANRSQAVVWNTDLGPDDITWLMRRAIGQVLVDRLDGDGEIFSNWLSGREATAEELANALRAKPGLVCTTSHGMTGPLDDAEALRAMLGSPVDQDGALVTAAGLGWSPGGAIWYSHACCSAGSDALSRYAGLISDTDEVGNTLRGVAAAAGARVAPLPEALLGASRPLRAFLGHVEPTFNWTLRDPTSNAVLTHTIVGCLYNRLYQADRPSPIGWALADTFSESARYFAEYMASTLTGADPAEPGDPLYQQLVAVDRQSLVVLGDPTVTLPKLGGKVA